MINSKDKSIILEFKNRLPARVKRHLKRLVIFGSRARGHGREDSDLDTVVLVDKKSAQIEKELEDVLYQVMWDHDFKPIVSLKIFTVTHFRNATKKGFSFYRYVEKEGITV